MLLEMAKVKIVQGTENLRLKALFLTHGKIFPKIHDIFCFNSLKRKIFKPFGIYT